MLRHAVACACIAPVVLASADVAAQTVGIEDGDGAGGPHDVEPVGRGRGPGFEGAQGAQPLCRGHRRPGVGGGRRCDGVVGGQRQLVPGDLETVEYVVHLDAAAGDRGLSLAALRGHPAHRGADGAGADEHEEDDEPGSVARLAGRSGFSVRRRRFDLILCCVCFRAVTTTQQKRNAEHENLKVTSAQLFRSHNLVPRRMRTTIGSVVVSLHLTQSQRK